MCICVSQEGAGAQFTCLCSITHPCIVGRKVASFCAFLWVIVILQLNSFEFIQPSWILSVYFYVCGETEPRREREGEKNPIALVGLTVGFTLKHEILHINILGLLSLQRLILEILPGETKVVCSQPLPCLPFLHRGLQGVPVALAASLEAFTPLCGGGLGPDLGHRSRAVPVAGQEVLARPGAMVGCCVEIPRLRLGSSQ